MLAQTSAPVDPKQTCVDQLGKIISQETLSGPNPISVFDGYLQNFCTQQQIEVPSKSKFLYKSKNRRCSCILLLLLRILPLEVHANKEGR